MNYSSMEHDGGFWMFYFKIKCLLSFFMQQRKDPLASSRTFFEPICNSHISWSVCYCQAGEFISTLYMCLQKKPYGQICVLVMCIIHNAVFAGPMTLNWVNRLSEKASLTASSYVKVGKYSFSVKKKCDKPIFWPKNKCCVQILNFCLYERIYASRRQLLQKSEEKQLRIGHGTT